MALGNDSASFDAGAAQKVLRLLEALKQSQAGGVIYRQVERMLEDLLQGHQQAEHTYLALLNVLLDAFASQLHPGSPLQVQVKLLQTRLQPPMTVSDLNAMRSYVELYADQIQQLQRPDPGLFQEALRPLLQAYGIMETVTVPAAGPAAAPTPAPPSVPASPPPAAVAAEPPPPIVTAEPLPLDTAAPQVDAIPAPPLPDDAIPASFVEDTRSDSTPPAESDDAPPADQQVASVYRSHLDAKQRDIQKLQATLAQQVLDTITQNQEFGVLLEVVLSELRQAGQVTELENLRWTLVREIEKLMNAHHDLADKLDSTHHYLQIIESDSRQLNDELTRVRLLSLTDELTGLPNRRAFLRRLEDEVARVQRYGFPLSLALIDLDKFKEVNDKYGHAGGDEVLRVYSRNILSIFRHHDLVARYGGEEFAVLLPNTDGEGAVRALSKVKKRAAETRWQCNGTIMPVPTFSAGLALYKPGETSTAFIERADKALYRAKRLGRDRVEMDMTYIADSEAESGDDAPAASPAAEAAGDGAGES